MSNGGIAMVVAILCVIVSLGFTELNYNIEQQNTEICNASPSCYSSSVSSSIASSISSSEASVSTSVYCSSLSSNAVGNESEALQWVGSQCPGGPTNLVSLILPLVLGIAIASMIGLVIKEKVLHI